MGPSVLKATSVCIFFFRFAYIEFTDQESVRTAMALDETMFRGRVIKVNGVLRSFLTTYSCILHKQCSVLPKKNQ